MVVAPSGCITISLSVVFWLRRSWRSNCYQWSITGWCEVLPESLALPTEPKRYDLSTTETLSHNFPRQT